ncbi:hypothetical protein M8J77_008458 [Diaphorina citri]|nr:hypothetical protein M8J77_003718 [Diaphorina citri]KAI5735032.1 hypothetical protein M8J77_013304 [Diaphorina citri]KAI5738555.1 hypothetical protein M8J77_008458 [Diaphorina citri]
MSFSSVLKHSLPATSRVSYAPRSNFNRNMGQSSGPKVDSLYLPKKCGFSLPFDPEIPMDKYLCAVGDLVGDEKMVFAGKNNDLVKIYLTSESEVTKLYENHPQIVIDSKPLFVNKLVDNGHKIFLCNVEPGVPDSALINELSKHTKVISPMKFVNLGSRNERFSHLIGYRRTVLVETIDDLPASFSLFYDNANYKIFVVIDKVKCFNCNAEGHLIKNCPVKNASAQERIEATLSANRAAPPPPKNDDIINTFLPSFSSKTPTTAVTPLPDVSVASPPPVNTVTSSLISPKENQVAAADINSHSQPTLAPLTPVSTEVVIENPGSSKPLNSPLIVPMETNQDICKKRSHDQSPPPTNSDKKPCVSTKRDELQCLAPVIEKYEPSIDASVFINLVRDLKNSKKKLEIIRDDYDMDPNAVISVLSKIVSDDPTSLDPKIMNRVKNLRKALVTLVGPVANNPASTSVNPIPTGPQDPVLTDSDLDLPDI